MFVLGNIIERVLGLDRGFLNRDGELGIDFNPHWPGPDPLTPYWNVGLALLALAWVVYVYRREGRSRPVRIALGVVRGTLLAFVLFLLNNPVLTLGQSRTEPSVVAVMLDDSVSMRVKDVVEGAESPTRLEAAVDLLADGDQALLKELAKVHQLRLYTFDKDARPLSGDAQPQAVDGPVDPAMVKVLEGLKPEGQNTQVLRALSTVLADLQGQRLAGVVVVTDGRETPATPVADALRSVKNYGVKVYPVAVGSDRAPTNIDLQAVSVQDSAFKDDIVAFKLLLRGSGYQPGHTVQVRLKDKKTGALLKTPEGRGAEKTVSIADDRPVEEEILFKPEQVGPLDIVAEAVAQPGELDEQDNTRTAQIAVLDARIAVLYVDGYPRWEYRYIKNEMIRDRTVNISCLLTSADPTFAQEGDPPAEGFPGPVRRFPESVEEIMQYDVVLFGDVDPRQFTDTQIALVGEFVSKRGGGFGMVAGPRWSPAAYRNTLIEAMLPVSIARAQPDAPGDVITEGFRPMLTREGAGSSIFRFFADRAANEKFLREELQPIFWYAKGVTAKPGVGVVYAEHPTETGPDGRKAPVLVLGRFGAGRTLFSGIDDSWRWRFYTGESVFDTYWIQQLRYLARSKKLGQRRITFTSDRPAYEQFEQVRLNVRVLDPVLLQQLPESMDVELVDEQGQPVRRDRLVRQEGQPENYLASFPADKVGRFTLRLTNPVGGESAAMDLPIEVTVPRLELEQPQVDRQLLTRLAAETLGQAVTFAEAKAALPKLIPSAAKVIPIQSSEPLWDAPLAMWIFLLLLTGEWVLRKVYGML
ncbi:MAG TPA: hypothetical protein VFB66_12510 [Tepidisphaeraceae bacterium]|nr:hypothetical protein [Tepidisphaeraceae bacterium]